MTRTLLLHDRLAPPTNRAAYLEVLDAQSREGCIKLFDAEKRADQYVPLAGLLADLSAGKLIVMRVGKPRYSLAAQANDDALHKRSRFVNQALRRVMDIQRQRGLSFRQAYALAADEYANAAPAEAPAFPAQSTMYRFRKCELADLPLLRGDKNKGNRRPRYPSEVVGTICDIARRHYLVSHSRWTLKALTEYANYQVRGTLLSAAAPLISVTFVKQTIKRYLTRDSEHERMLPADAVAAKSFAKRRIRADWPFERVEQDALHLPFVAETPSGPTNSLWLVHAIECCASYPVGWRLVVGSVTDRETLECAEMYVTPIKKQRFKEMGIDHDVNVFGTPGALVFDNGPEAKGSRIQRLEKLGIDVQHCRARAGQEKPFIERLNRSLKEALEGLPGCTRLDGQDGKRDPVALGDKLPTVEELERWIVRWYFEKWVHHSLERLRWDAVLSGKSTGNTPAERWKYFEDSCTAVSLPPARAEWLAALYEHDKRRLSRKTGITLEGLHYKGDAIGALLARYGEAQPLHVLYNPDDFRHVFIYENDETPLVTLQFEHLRPETPAFSFAEAKERFKAHKAASGKAPQANQFDADMYEAAAATPVVPRGKRSGKRAQNRETTQREREARAVRRADTAPAPPPRTRRADSLTMEPVANVYTSPPATSPQTGGQLPADDIPLFPWVDRNSGDSI